ncbi:hypothetical protein [Candidatus Uabimicrobium sp. HlEnr_7]|uniref:hypothetical protein n=1 Tax=Candidatus Uabimicrobium helgolandensis TaxID=3095367 RepID=UPI003557530F
MSNNRYRWKRSELCIMVVFLCATICTLVQVFSLQIGQETTEMHFPALTSSRRLTLQIDNDYRPGTLMKLDEILVGGKKFLATDFLFPGDHRVILRKKGFEELSFLLNVSIGITPVIVKKTLISKPRFIVIEVTHDFLAENDKFYPELLVLGGREMELSERFKPGVHDLVIAHPGFKKITEKIKIEPGEGQLVLKRNLVANSRPLIVNLAHDVESNIAAHKVFLRGVKESEFYPAGEMIFPGEYQVKIEKEGYRLYLGRAVVFPDNRPYKFSAKLTAKYLKVIHDIKYDVEPGSEAKALGDCEVTLIGENVICRNVQQQNRIKPGNYILEITRPGYEFRENKKNIRISPSEKPYVIRETLHAKARSLSFGLFDDCCIFEAEQVLIDGTSATPETKFFPGIEYSIIAHYISYKTMKKTIVVEPGEGPYAIKTNLTKLKRYRISIGKKYYQILGSINEPIKLFIDGIPLEQHHISVGDGFNLMNYEFYAPKEMQTLRVVCGFYYDKSPVKYRFEFRELSKIDPSLLLQHLQNLAKSGPIRVLHCMARLLDDKKDKRKVVALSKESRQEIVNLLLMLTVSKEERTMQKAIINRLSIEK